MDVLLLQDKTILQTVFHKMFNLKVYFLQKTS